MRKTRISLFVITVLLISIGIVMIYSSSAVYAYERFGESFYFLERHLLYLTIGFFATLAVMGVDYRTIRKYNKLILLVSLVLLVLVLIPALSREAGGARRWLRFWKFGFQPSEAVKLALVFYMADILSRRQSQIKSFFHGFLPPVVLLGGVVGLILLQPDLGTALLIAAIGVVMFFASGIKLSHIFGTFLVSLPILYCLIFNIAYRKNRILTFLNPWSDPRGSGFQMVQSYLALGCGGLLGVGLGHSEQKLFYLPASHTDFIFSIIGEELGLFGTASVVILFGLFVWQGMKISVHASEVFGQLLAIGIVSLVGLEAIINIGVSTGFLPTKGLPLPFISYGGTSLVFKMMSVGLLLNVGKDIQ